MATDKINIIAGYLNAFAHEALDVDTLTILTASKYTNSESQYAKRAVITVETNAPIRYTYDGTTPSSTIGHRANPTDVIILNTSGNIKNFKAIKQGATAGKIMVTYEI